MAGVHKYMYLDNFPNLETSHTMYNYCKYSTMYVGQHTEEVVFLGLGFGWSSSLREAAMALARASSSALNVSRKRRTLCD